MNFQLFLRVLEECDVDKTLSDTVQFFEKFLTEKMNRKVQIWVEVWWEACPGS